MPVDHEFQSGRADNGDPGAIQPSHFNATHRLTGMLAVLDTVAPTPNVVLTLDGSSNLVLQPTAIFAPVYSPQFAGVPTAPTPALGTNNTQLATMEALQAAITALIGGAPGALDTLKELADAINDDASFAATVTAALAVRLRVDAAQGLTTPQKTQALANLGVILGVAASNVLQLDGSARIPAVDGSLLTNIPYASLTGKPTLGTAAALNVGTAASQVVQLDGTAKLPAVDGSQLTNVTPGAGAVRYDTAQGLSGAQKDQARVNAAAFGVIRRTVFTATGTWTPNANLIYADVEGVGGGGAGGGIPTISTSVGSGAGGGQSGDYSRSIISAATAGATQAVTIGTGGAGASGANGGQGVDTSVGALVVAKGGGGGAVAAAGNQTVGASGDNRTAGTGDFKVNGGGGGTGLGGSTQLCAGGSGGASFFGSGGPGQVASGGGVAGIAYGSGGGGAAGINGAVASAGGNGAPGVVIITEYCTK
ncbi:hypothetical protein HAP41_0000033350 [Bradyrhizobium barranii subsp. apii]|uniref:Glycine-rich domain-containing protein n=1 Tax=Bradyrhizobium barranii subsp. apii TaxID=2819348 RepID=A0A8T5V3R0_9BRAD|nr:hypothetical protein [Bradyrhizobium barranii]UPT85177.1 hypothetical protein HAP41_0000033350 [Bradyrhizobium barranii subsp. apii]